MVAISTSILPSHHDRNYPMPRKRVRRLLWLFVSRNYSLTMSANTQAESVIKNIIKEVAKVCLSMNYKDPETLAAFMVNCYSSLATLATDIESHHRLN